MTAAGSFSGNRAALNAEFTSGGSFNSADPVPMQDTGYGTITLVFTSCTAGNIEYDFPGVGLSGSFAIGRD